jgi:hypothetical protein
MKTKFTLKELTAAKNARRLLLMVAELHRLGYEGIRAAPYLSPSGCNWRCTIVPATLISREYGARLVEDVDYASLPKYSSADGANYFGWRDLKRKSPLAMAKRYIVEFPTFAERGKQPDPAYVRWFVAMLELTAPIGSIYAFGDFESPNDRMPTSFCDESVVVRMPPVGLGRCEICPRKASTNINNIDGLFSTRL